MDDLTFDRLTRLLGNAKSRRVAVQSVLTTVLGGALLSESSSDVAAAKKGKGKGKKGGGGGGQGSNAGRHGRPGKQRKRRRRGEKNNGPDNEQGNTGGGTLPCAEQGVEPQAGQPCCTPLVTDTNGVCNLPVSTACEDTCFGDNVCCNDVCANGNCCDGNQHVFCSNGETCDTPNGCKCGNGSECADGETCNGNECICETPKFTCEGRCTDCQPGSVSTSTSRVSAQAVEFCCEPTDAGGYCSCNGSCCEERCFDQTTTAGVTTSFCCTEPGYIYCEDDSKQQVCCACGVGQICNCAECLSGPESPGRISAVRRPR